MADKVRGDRVGQPRIQAQASKTANTQEVQMEMNMKIFPGRGNCGKAARIVSGADFIIHQYLGGNDSFLKNCQELNA